MIILMRPFKAIENNLVEIINELFLSLIVVILLFLNSETKWTGSKESAFLGILTINSLTILVVLIGRLKLVQSFN